MNDLQQSKQPVLVTGAMGFLGSFVIGKLIQSGYYVRVMTRNKPIADRKNVDVFVGDLSICNYDFLLRDVCAVVHLASTLSNDWEQIIEQDVRWMHELLKRSQGKRFVFASSFDVYAPYCEGSIHEDQETAPSNWYGLGKLFCEKLIRFTEHYDREGIYTVIRFPFIFDRHPAFPNSMLGEIIEKAKTGVNFEFPFQNGFKYGTSWISGNDAADAIVISLGKSSGGIFNVASGYIEWQYLVSEVVKETGNQSRINHSDPDISPRSIFNTRRELGTSKFSEILHFKPKDTFRSTVMRILNGKQP